MFLNFLLLNSVSEDTSDRDNAPDRSHFFPRLVAGTKVIHMLLKASSLQSQNTDKVQTSCPCNHHTGSRTFPSRIIKIFPTHSSPLLLEKSLGSSFVQSSSSPSASGDRASFDFLGGGASGWRDLVFLFLSAKPCMTILISFHRVKRPGGDSATG